MTISKNFVVTGTPRSGTTFFCNYLRNYPQIWFPRFSNNDNVEPFNPVNLPVVSNSLNVAMFDQDLVMQKLFERKATSGLEYFGFKTFLSFHGNMLSLIEHNQLDVFVVLRKNIWMVMGSLLLAHDNQNYQGSSKRFSKFHYDGSAKEERQILTMFHTLCRDYWYSENIWCNHPRFVEKIYFEDLIKPNASFEKLNCYFDQEINFLANYTDESVSKYFENFDQVQQIVMKNVYKAPQHFLMLPDYISKELGI